jgi:CubicO group peptidase (beta-lactamase class C family)
MRRLIFLIFALLHALALSAQQAGPADAKEIEATIAPLFDQQLNSRRFEAAAVVVVRGDQVLFARGFGVDPATRSPVDVNSTVFRAASVSKLFVTTAVLQLVERGQLRLDDDVNHYFTRFQLRPEQSPPVTAATLLTHTSGIENWVLGSLVRSPLDLVPLGDYYARRPPRTFRTPGSELTYSNQGMALAGHLVEVASSESFQDYAQQHILGPLGMRHSTFRQTSAPAFLPYPAVSLTSTVADMGQFLRMQLNHGRVADQQVLQPGTVADMQQQHWTAHQGQPGVAYGFFESYWNGERVLFHTGDSGDHSLLLLLPQRGWGCYAVYRGGGGDSETVREEFMAALMDHYCPAAPFVLPEPHTGNSNLASLSKYTGLYRASTVNPYSIEKVLGITRQVHILPLPDGSLQLRELKVRAVEVEPELFRTEGGGYLSFRAAADGRIVGGTITGSIWDPQSFDRIAWWESGSLHIRLLAICAILLFSRLAVGAVDAIRRKKPISPAGLRAQRMPLIGWRLSGFLPLLVICGALCLLGNLLVWRPPITSLPPGAVALLAFLTGAAIIGVTLSVFAVWAWAAASLGAARRIYFSILSLAGLLFAAILYYWNLLGIHT